MHDPETGERYISLGNQLYAMTHVVLPPKIVISKIDYMLFKEMGYTDEEALLLCGYESACFDVAGSWSVMCRFDADTMERYTPNDEVEKKCEEARSDERKKVLAETDEAVRKAVSAQTAAEDAQRKTAKELRVECYTTNKLESRVAELEEKCRELERQLGLASRENAELRETLDEYTKPLLIDEEDDPVPETANYQYPMPEVGKKVKLLVVGGPTTWANELTKRFPSITVYGADDIPNDSSYIIADIILINTFYIQHKDYWPVKNFADKNGIPVRFCKSRGVNACSEQIIELGLAD